MTEPPNKPYGERTGKGRHCMYCLCPGVPGEEFRSARLEAYPVLVERLRALLADLADNPDAAHACEDSVERAHALVDGLPND